MPPLASLRSIRTRPGRRWLAVGLILATANAPAPPAPHRARASIEARYERADRYLRPGLDALLVDDDLRADFTRDGRGIVYRLGHADNRSIRYFDLAAATSHTIVMETPLARMLAKAVGKPVEAVALRLEDPVYDTATSVLTFGAADRRWTVSGGTLSEAAKGPPQGDGAVSPDGRFEVVARNFNLVARDRRSGREVALTTDGTREQPYGRDIPTLAEILKAGAEEPDMPVSGRWSPDSRKLLTWRLDTRDVPRLSITQETRLAGSIHAASPIYTRSPARRSCRRRRAS